MEGATIYSSERTREAHGILAGIGAGLVCACPFYFSLSPKGGVERGLMRFVIRV